MGSNAGHPCKYTASRPTAALASKDNRRVLLPQAIISQSMPTFTYYKSDLPNNIFTVTSYQYARSWKLRMPQDRSYSEEPDLRTTKEIE